jgi:hypothetical protein
MIVPVVTCRSIEVKAPPPLGCPVTPVIVVLFRIVSWAISTSPVTIPAGLGTTSVAAAAFGVETPTERCEMAGSMT